MIRKLRDGQEGALALTMLLAFMALAVPLVTSALQLSSTLSSGSRLTTNIVKSQYCAMAGDQYAVYRLAYETGFAEALPIGTPVNFQMTCAGQNVTVTVQKTTEPPPPPAGPSSESGRELRTTKTVQPNSATGGVPTTFTYQITVDNIGTDPLNLVTIYDLLPSSDFSYVNGSTTGVTTNDPEISGNELKWDGLTYTIPSGDSTTLDFQAQATLSTGTYCNEAYVDPGGQSKSTSGLTAKISAGTGGSGKCPGAAVVLTKSVTPSIVPSEIPQTLTYTISVENIGTMAVHLKKLKDLLPSGFDYLTGSSSGLWNQDPSISGAGTPWELIWDVGQRTIPVGETRTQVFQATATIPNTGQFFNEVWATFDEISYEVYTWPTAMVEAMSVMGTSATDGKTTVDGVVWIGADGYVITAWDLK